MISVRYNEQMGNYLAKLAKAQKESQQEQDRKRTNDDGVDHEETDKNHR